MAITDEEKRILDEWPVITREELLRINQYFKHYLFWRKEKWDGGILWRIACSCCGKRLELTQPRRVETPEEREFLGSLAHREKTRCPWCGADVTMIALSRAGKRKNLTSGTRLILLHNRDGILYADALEPYKLYDTDKDLTAVPRHWLLQLGLPCGRLQEGVRLHAPRLPPQLRRVSSGRICEIHRRVF